MKVRISLIVVTVLVLLFTLAFPVHAQAPAPGAVPEFKLTPQSLIELGAFILSLTFKYFPKLRTWYGALESGTKSGLMIAMLLLLTVGVTTLACFNLISIPDFQCSQVGFVGMAWTFVWAVTVNQGAYKLFPDTQDVKAAKATRSLPVDGWMNGVH